MVYPAPPYTQGFMQVRKGPFWYPVSSGPHQYGSGFIIRGSQSTPCHGVRYFPAPGQDWDNIVSGVLDPIDLGVPYP